MISLAACSGGSGSSSDDNNKQADVYVNWKSIPEKYNPNMSIIPINISGLKYLDTSISGFQRDVKIVYSSGFSKNQGELVLYTVREKKNGFGFGNMHSSQGNSRLSISGGISNNCSISVVNKAIKELEGSCYVAIDIILPTDAKIEVRNIGTLLTKEFFPMEVEYLIGALDKTSGSEEKLKLIDDFFTSYDKHFQKAALDTAEMKEIFSHFGFSDEKLNVLRKMHAAITDRENLGSMIDEVFGSSFDREDAKKIVGLD